MSAARTVVITQSNYLPWRGWFDMVRRADALVLLDSVQYTRRDWRNRNRIRTERGLAWITLPIDVSGRYHQPIDEARIADDGWADNHLALIRQAYARAACFAEVFPWLTGLLRSQAAEPMLSRVNEALIAGIFARLGLTRPILRDTALLPRETLFVLDPSERLAALAEAAGATRYLTGPAARAYMDEAPFARRGIGLDWMAYPDYPAYPQLWGGFEPAVSIIDLLLNTGDAAPGLIWP